MKGDPHDYGRKRKKMVKGTLCTVNGVSDYYRDLLSPETREKLEKANEMRKDQSRA